MSFDQGRPDFLTNRPIEKFRWNPNQSQDIPTKPGGYIAQEKASDATGNLADPPMYSGFNTDAPYYYPLPFCRGMGGNDGYTTYMGGGGILGELLKAKQVPVGKIMLTPWRFGMTQEVLRNKPVLFSQQEIDAQAGMQAISVFKTV